MITGRRLRHLSQGGFLLLSSTIFAAAGHANSQSLPPNVIRIVVPAGPGTPPNVLSRIIATELSEGQGWRVTVENRPGALETIAMGDVLKQPPDGRALYAMSVPTMAAQALFPNLGLRPETDFAPVIKISSGANVLVVNPSVPAKSVSELVNVLKNQPDKFIFSSGPFGTPAHLIGELFKLKTGVRTTHVPYQQGPQRMVDLLNGTSHFSFYNMPAVVDLIATGKLRALAVTAPRRIATLKDVPTTAEQGYPELVVEDWVGFAVKGGTPNETVMRLNQAVNKALTKYNVREAYANLGAEPVGGTSADFGLFIKSQVAHWGNVVRESGIKMPQ